MASAAEDFSQFGISKEEKDKLVGEVIRFVLFKSHHNSGCPIKREDLTQIVTKNYRQRNIAAYVINEARSKLSSIFGYDLKELQRSRPSLGQVKSSQSQGFPDLKSYVLASQLPAEMLRKYIEDPNTAPMTGFTFVVLGIVHLAGGKIPEENLWHHLKRLGLHDGDENNQVVGNTKQALETLVQQRFLQKENINGPDGNTLFYELAERALDDQVGQKIKDYISEILKKDVSCVEID